MIPATEIAIGWLCLLCVIIVIASQVHSGGYPQIFQKKEQYDRNNYASYHNLPLACQVINMITLVAFGIVFIQIFGPVLEKVLGPLTSKMGLTSSGGGYSGGGGGYGDG